MRDIVLFDLKPKSKPVGEYKRTCNECGKVWHSLVDREKFLKTSLFGDACGMCGSPNQAQYSRNYNANESSLAKLNSCPSCGSTNYTQEIVYYDKW